MFSNIKTELIGILRRPLLWTTVIIGALFIVFFAISLTGALHDARDRESESWKEYVQQEMLFIDQELLRLENLENQGFDLNEELSPGYSYLDYRQELIEELQNLIYWREIGFDAWQKLTWEKELAELIEALDDLELHYSVRNALEQDKLWYELKLAGHDQDEIDRQVRQLITHNKLEELEQWLAEGTISAEEYQSRREQLLLELESLESKTTGDHNAYTFTVQILAIMGLFLVPFFAVFQSAELFAAAPPHTAPAGNRLFFSRFIAMTAALFLVLAVLLLFAVIAGGISFTFAGFSDKAVAGVDEASFTGAYLLSLGALVFYMTGALFVASAVLAAITFSLVAAFHSFFTPALAALTIFFTDFVFRMIVGIEAAGAAYRMLPFLHLHAFHQISELSYFYPKAFPPGQSVLILFVYMAIFLIAGSYIFTYRKKQEAEPGETGKRNIAGG